MGLAYNDLCLGDNVQVNLPRNEIEAFSIQPGNREWVSIIECISASRYILPPFIIFKRSRIQYAWIDDKTDDDIVKRVGPNGWIDRSIALA